MITAQNPKYKLLFAEAYNILNEYDKLSEETKANGAITSLEEYFTYIGDLAKLHGDAVKGIIGESVAQEWNEHFANTAKYLMLPIDEEYFKINTNTRTIAIPSIFSTAGVSLFGDQRAETLLFEVDRYFDFVDLLRTTIYIQWKNPNGTEGGTVVSLVDYDNEKIRFGWTITDAITVNGNNNLTFSVRFFMRNDEGKITYSLNTIPVSVKIKSPLRIDLEDNIFEYDEAPGLFTEAIVNGANSNTTPPLNPIIDAVIPVNNTKVYLDVNNMRQFIGGAHAKDTGVISYTWKINPKNGESPITLGQTSVNETYKTEIIFEETNDSAFNPDKKYYIDEGSGAYSLVLGTEFADGVTYYEPRAQLTILNSTNPITGKYFLNIKNTIGKNESNILGGEWTISGPESITYNTNLNERDNFIEPVYKRTEDAEKQEDKTYYVKNADGDFIEFSGEAFENSVEYYELEKTIKELSVSVVADDSAADLSYQWYTIDSEESENEIEGATQRTYEVTEPGWYRVKTTSTLNRDSISQDSTKAKVTFPPVAPTIIHDEDAENGVVTIYFSDTSTPTVTLSVDHSPIINELASEGITYHWKYQKPDIETAFDTQIGVVGVESISENNLTIKYSEPGIIFFCEVTNSLNDRTATAVSDKYFIAKI